MGEYLEKIKTGLHTVSKQKRCIISITLSLFIIFLFYALFLLQDLSFYMYGYDDFHLIHQTLNISFTGLLSRIFFYPLELYQGFLHLGIYQRAVHGLFLKASYIIAGLYPFFHHALRAVFFALTGVLVFLFTKKITKNNIVSIAAGGLYCSLPVVYDGLRHIGAAEPFSQFFLLLALYLFVCFYTDQENDTDNTSRKQKFLYPMLLFIVALFAIKAREPEIILLPVIGSFLLLKYKQWRKNIKWYIVLFVLSLYIFPAILTQVSVVEDTQHSTIGITAENVLTNINHLLVYNPVTRTGNGEQTLVIFSLRQYISETPGSLLGSLGFFIGWYFIAMLTLALYFVWKNKCKKETTENNKLVILPNTAFIVGLLWFFFSVLLIILYVNPSDHSDIRYIGVIALPTIIVIVSFCYFVTLFIKESETKYISKYILTLFFLVLFLSIVINAGITGVYRRGGIGSRHLGMSLTTETLFEDLYNQSFDPIFFFAITEISGDGKEIPCTFSTNISLSDVTVTNDPFLSITRSITDENIQQSLSDYGFVYLVSYALPLSLEQYPDMQLVGVINTCENGYYCHLKKLIAKQKLIAGLFKEQLNNEPRFYLHKIVTETPSFEKPVTLFCAGQEGLH